MSARPASRSLVAGESRVGALRMMNMENSVSAFLARFRGRLLLRKVAENAGWQMTDKIMRAVVGLLVGVWVARYLGPKEFGSLNFAVAFTAVFFPAADLGLQAVVIRDLVRNPGGRTQIVGSAIVLRLAGAAVSIGLITVCALLSRPGDMASLTMNLAVALSFVAQAWDIIDYDYQARMQPRPIALTRVVSLLVFAAVKVALILLRAPVIWFALAISGEAALSAAVFRRLGASLPGGLRLAAARRAEMLELLHRSWPLAISALSVILYMRIDQVMLGEMLGDRAVGIFSAAVRVSESWLFVPMAVVAAAAPALTAAHQSSQSDYLRRSLAVVRVLLWMGLIAALLISLSSHAIIQFLYGAGYQEAGSVLAIHAWAGVFASLGLASGPWFVNAGILRLRMLYTMIGAIVNCSLNLYVIPRYGVVGAAVSTLISYGVAGLLLNASSRRSRPIFAIQLRSFTFR